MLPLRQRALLLGLVLLLPAPGCQRGGVESEPAAQSPASGPIEAAGLHNVFRITDKLYSGSSPEGDVGFLSLRQLGVKTIISVDGTKPDVAAARKYGMRYVHLPIGYDGVPEEQARRLARAVRDLPGAVYLHCHHGKHRGPAAAAAVHVCLDEKCTAEVALAEMRRAGTDPRYLGLYAAPRQFRALSAEELDRVSADFPETAAVAALAEQMVAIDERWDRLKLVRAAGWKVPPTHPDVEPAHEALQLLEGYREAARAPRVKQRSEELHRWLGDAEAAARDLEKLLRAGKDRGSVDEAAAETAFQRSAKACAQCHAKYRDVPQTP